MNQSRRIQEAIDDPGMAGRWGTLAEILDDIGYIMVSGGLMPHGDSARFY